MKLPETQKEFEDCLLGIETQLNKRDWMERQAGLRVLYNLLESDIGQFKDHERLFILHIRSGLIYQFEDMRPAVVRLACACIRALLQYTDSNLAYGAVEWCLQSLLKCSCVTTAPISGSAVETLQFLSRVGKFNSFSYSQVIRSCVNKHPVARRHAYDLLTCTLLILDPLLIGRQTDEIVEALHRGFIDAAQEVRFTARLGYWALERIAPEIAGELLAQQKPQVVAAIDAEEVMFRDWLSKNLVDGMIAPSSRTQEAMMARPNTGRVSHSSLLLKRSSSRHSPRFFQSWQDIPAPRTPGGPHFRSGSHRSSNTQGNRSFNILRTADRRSESIPSASSSDVFVPIGSATPTLESAAFRCVSDDPEIQAEGFRTVLAGLRTHNNQSLPALTTVLPLLERAMNDLDPVITSSILDILLTAAQGDPSLQNVLETHLTHHVLPTVLAATHHPDSAVAEKAQELLIVLANTFDPELFLKALIRIWMDKATEDPSLAATALDTAARMIGHGQAPHLANLAHLQDLLKKLLKLLGWPVTLDVQRAAIGVVQALLDTFKKPLTQAMQKHHQKNPHPHAKGLDLVIRGVPALSKEALTPKEEPMEMAKKVELPREMLKEVPKKVEVPMEESREVLKDVPKVEEPKVEPKTDEEVRRRTLPMEKPAQPAFTAPQQHEHVLPRPPSRPEKKEHTVPKRPTSHRNTRRRSSSRPHSHRKHSANPPLYSSRRPSYEPVPSDPLTKRLSNTEESILARLNNPSTRKPDVEHALRHAMSSVKHDFHPWNPAGAGYELVRLTEIYCGPQHTLNIRRLAIHLVTVMTQKQTLLTLILANLVNFVRALCRAVGSKDEAVSHAAQRTLSFLLIEPTPNAALYALYEALSELHATTDPALAMSMRYIGHVLVRAHGNPAVDKMLPRVMMLHKATLLSPNPSVRKATVMNCADAYLSFTDAILPHFSTFTPAQHKLISTYINRQLTNQKTSSTYPVNLAQALVNAGLSISHERLEKRQKSHRRPSQSVPKLLIPSNEE